MRKRNVMSKAGIIDFIRTCNCGNFILFNNDVMSVASLVVKLQVTKF